MEGKRKMIETRYGDHVHELDLAEAADTSIAEAREFYEDEYGMPKGTNAVLNGRAVAEDLESKLMLNEGDRLSFVAKRKSRTPMILGALLLSLLISGGVFAFAWTSANASIGAIAKNDIAEVSVESIPDLGNVWGHYRGEIPADGNPVDVFKIDIEDEYTGDLQVDVYLTNVHDLSKVYKHINMKLQLVDYEGDVLHSTSGHEWELLTLENGRVKLDLDKSLISSPTDNSIVYVKLLGGGFTTHNQELMPWSDGYAISPVMFCEVTQR